MTILLAEDETQTRQSIARMLEAISGVELVDKAADGNTAIKMLKKYNYDILITDICMPGASGLDIIKFIRERNLNIELLIMSGYNNFEYAHQALKYHVMDYLLKPVDPMELTNIMLKLTANIASKTFNEKSSRTSFFNKLLNVENNLSTKKLLDEMNSLKIPTDFNLYMISFLMMQTSSGQMTAEQNDRMHGFLKNLRTYDVIAYDFPYQGFDSAILFMFNNTTVPKALEKAKEISVELENFIYNETNMHSTLFAAPPVSSLQMLFHIQQAARKRAIAEFNQTSPFILCQEMEPDKEAVTSSVRNFNNLIDNLLAITHTSEKEIREYVNKVAKEMKTLMLNSELDADRCMARFKLSLGNIVSEEQSSPELTTLMNDLLASEKLSTKKDCIERILLLVRQMKLENNVPVSKLICTHIENRIQSHLSEEDFTVLDAIEGLNYSENYIRYIFKHHTGMSIKEYIIKEKIEKAKQLLAEDIQIKKVAAMTGYNNQRYFACCFKSYTGMTPSEWKNQN